MDNFMDKLAQRLNAQDVIRANSQAEAAELKRLRLQMEAYEQCLREIQDANAKNEQAAEKMQEMLDKSCGQADRSEELTMRAAELAAQAQKILEEGIDKVAGMPQEVKEEREQFLENIREAFAEHQKTLSEQFHASEDFVHKENVKVYRNVQAVIVDELKAQTELLTGKSEEQAKKAGGLKPLVIVAAALSGINLVLLAVQLLLAFGVI